MKKALIALALLAMVVTPLFPVQPAEAAACSKMQSKSQTAKIRPEEGKGLNFKSTVNFTRCAKTDVIYSMKLEWSGDGIGRCAKKKFNIGNVQSVTMNPDAIAGRNHPAVTWKCPGSYQAKYYYFGPKSYAKGTGDRCFKVAVHVKYSFSRNANRTISMNCAR
jgi:hypothetical protein